MFYNSQTKRDFLKKICVFIRPVLRQGLPDDFLRKELHRKSEIKAKGVAVMANTNINIRMDVDLLQNS